MLYVLVFLPVSFLLALPPITYMHFPPSNSCYMPCSSDPSWHYSNNTWRRVQVITFHKLRMYQNTYESTKFIFRVNRLSSNKRHGNATLHIASWRTIHSLLRNKVKISYTSHPKQLHPCPCVHRDAQITQWSSYV
jgi:hypothetical protein